MENNTRVELVESLIAERDKLSDSVFADRIERVDFFNLEIAKHQVLQSLIDRVGEPLIKEFQHFYREHISSTIEAEELCDDIRI